MNRLLTTAKLVFDNKQTLSVHERYSQVKIFMKVFDIMDDILIE